MLHRQGYRRFESCLELFEQVFDQVCAGDDATQFPPMDDGDRMKVSTSEDLCRIFDRGGVLQAHGVFVHQLLNAEGVIQGGIHRTFVSLESFSKADAQDVCPCDDAHQFVSAYDGDVMHAMLTNELADFGDGLAMMDGDEMAAHDVGDGVVAFHGGV